MTTEALALPRPLSRRTRLLVGVSLAAVVVALAAIGLVRAAAQWDDDTAEVDRQLTAAAASAPSLVSSDDLSGLPAPVQRYFRLALPAGRPRIRAVRLEQTGRLRTGADSQQWLDFQARQAIVPAAHGFVWDARVRVAPFVHVRVRDAYVAGVGSGQVAVQSAITVSRERGGHDLNAANLFRLLAEAAWCPTLLLPGDAVTWTAHDDRRAVASMTQGGETVSVEFRFNDAGEIAGIYAANRPREYGTVYVPTPWEGHFTQYETVDGIRVPRKGEVGWWIDGRWVPVWEGTMEAIAFDTVR